MSTALGIAATTRVLGALIEQAIGASGVGSVVGSPPYLTTKAPDQLETGAGEASRLSLFLYHVTHNQGWREVALPSRNGAGASVDRPPLALDLHYLMIAYGDAEYAQQILLGLGMQALHETPLLYRKQIGNVFTPPPPLNAIDAALATADLADQIEMIKVVPEPLTTEDLSKLWTAFGGKFRPSAGFEATVVLIESTTAVRSGLPVLARNLSVLQFRQLHVAAVTPQFLPWSASLTVTLSGDNLDAQGAEVVFDGNPTAPQTPAPVGTGGARATSPVPGLPAGLNTLRVVQHVSIGAAPPKNVVESNVAYFFLQPVIRPGGAPQTWSITPGVPTGSPPTNTVKVDLDPALHATQRVQLLLNELTPPAGEAPLAFTFDAVPAQIAPNSVTFTTFGTRAGNYLVRVRVDGAESVLVTDAVTHAFANPTVHLP